MDEKKDLVSSSAMISCFAHNGMESQSVATFADMLRFGECPNEFCLAAVIQACCRPDYARTGMVLFGFVMKTGYFESELCVGCALIDMFAKGRGDLGSAKKVFDGMPERNLVTWTLVIMTRCTQLGCPEDAIDLFVEMVLSGFVPDRFTFSTVVSACAGLGLLTFGQQLHNWVGKSSLCFNVAVGCSLFDIYAKCASDGSVDDTRKVFDRLSDRNVMSWTAIITGYVQSGGLDKEAVELCCRMIEDQVSPNHC